MQNASWKRFFQYDQVVRARVMPRTTGLARMMGSINGTNLEPQGMRAVSVCFLSSFTLPVLLRDVKKLLPKKMSCSYMFFAIFGVATPCFFDVKMCSRVCGGWGVSLSCVGVGPFVQTDASVPQQDTNSAG